MLIGKKKKKETLLEANNKKKMIKFSVLVSFLYRLTNRQLNYANLWQVSQMFLLEASPGFVIKFREKVQLILCLCSQFFFLPLLSCALQCTLESLIFPGSRPTTTWLFFLLTDWVTFPPYLWIKSAASSLSILFKMLVITNVSPSKQFSAS